MGLAQVVCVQHAPTGMTVRLKSTLTEFSRSKIKMSGPGLGQQYLDKPGSKRQSKKSTQKADQASKTRKTKKARQTPNCSVRKPNQRSKVYKSNNKQSYPVESPNCCGGKSPLQTEAIPTSPDRV